jgi:cytidine deaminase
MPAFDLDRDRINALRDAAASVSLHAYAPYSGFKVGAALLLESGEVVTGANVENASYGLTMCAERSAIFRAVARQGPELRVVAIAIANRNGVASAPCGACRQVLSEFMSGTGLVLFPGAHGEEERRFDELMPFVFHLP